VTFADPERTYRVLTRPGPAGGAVLIFDDLTDRRRTEEVRRDFVANVSHELKTPLTALRAALEILLDGGMEDPPHAREFLETAQNQVERLQRLLDDLLTLSRLEKANPPPVRGNTPLAPAVDRAFAALAPLAERRGVRLINAVPPGSELPLAEDALSQVLINLVDNAIKFNREGGAVTVAGEATPAGTTLTVSDTGVGIPPEDLPRIFERFYRVDRSRARETGGTGLGLAIVKHIVENAGGAIGVASVPSEGTRFDVTLISENNRR
jgi:two-component system phosphate regulon sensor histidine kinase PhoR